MAAVTSDGLGLIRTKASGDGGERKKRMAAKNGFEGERENGKE
jgi:hypothetical protein